MESRIMQVFYGNDCLPYKDSARSVHYPIIGNSFIGANNTTQIRFYVRDIGGVNNVSWVAISKLPNGQIGSQVLNDIQLDEELNEYYVVLDLNNFYTQLKGDVFISLNGYQGGIQIEEDGDSGIYTITGTPTIQATGSIKLAINYAPQLPFGPHFNISDLAQILGALSDKANVTNTIQVVADISTEDLSGYENGQYFYSISSQLYYVKDDTATNGYKLAETGLLGSSKTIYRTLSLDIARLGSLPKDKIICINTDPIGNNDYLYKCVELQTFPPKYQATVFDLLNKKFYSKTYGTDFALATLGSLMSSANEIKLVEQTNTANILYGTDDVGNQDTIGYSKDLDGDYIVQRKSNAQIVVPTTPLDNNDATSKKYVDDQITSFKENELQVVNELPSVGEEGIIYLLPIDPQDLTKGYYRYIWENNEWLSLGTTEIDLSNYYTKPQAEDTFVPYSGATKNIDINTKEISGRVSNSDNTKYGGFDILTDSHGSTIFEGLLQVTRWQVNREYQSKANYKADRIEFVPNMNQQQYNYVLYLPSENGTLATKEYANTFGKTLECSIDSSTYVMTLVLKDNSGNVLSTQTIDLPLETMVVSGSYDDTTKSLVLTLKNGETITIPVGDLVDGLASESDLQDLANDISRELENYAKVDGNYPTLTAGLADNFTPYSEDSGAEQENPFISNGTGTNNNTEIVTVGDYGLLKEKQGHTVCVNQKVQNGNFESTSNWSAYDNNYVSLSVSNNKCTVTITDNSTPSAYRYGIIQTLQGIVPNHTYFLKADIETDIQDNAIETDDFGGYRIITSSGIIFNNTSSQSVLLIRPRYTTGISVGSYYSIKNIMLVDLTQMFNGDIPQDLLDNPSHFFWYYNGDLSYNTGSLENADGVKLVSTGRNIWDEQWELGDYNSTNGNNYADNTRIRSKSTKPIRVIPNTTYYRKTPQAIAVFFYDKDLNYIGAIGNGANNTFTTPVNCFYIKFAVVSAYGTTYKNDITISLYYTPQEGGEGYDKYYPYEQPYVVDTGTEVLRQAGSVKDYKEPNGTIHRLVGVVDLGSLTYTRQETSASGIYYFYADISTITNIKYATGSQLLKGQSNLYLIDTGSNVQAGLAPNLSLGSSSTQLRIRNDGYSNASTFKTAMSGVYLFYELAEPITEQGTPFAENLPINDYGMLYWLDSSDNLVGIPQGCKIFYPTNYKGFLDDLYSKVDGNSNDYALNSELNAKFETYLKSLSGYDETATQVLKNVEGTLTWVTEE